MINHLLILYIEMVTLPITNAWRCLTVTIKLDDILDREARGGKPKRYYDDSSRAPGVRKSLGLLHELLSQKLPDLLDRSGTVCDAYKLAPQLGMTFQGVYLILNKNKLTADNVNRIVALSVASKHRSEGFIPATLEDFWDYLSR
jgi:hypothetical protein